MLFVLAMSASIYGTDFPDSFRQGDVARYTRCLREEVNEVNEPFPENPSKIPMVTLFSQLVGYCGAERSRALATLRVLIKQRNPDWLPDKLASSAEFVLTGIDLENLMRWRTPNDVGVHDWPRREF